MSVWRFAAWSLCLGLLFLATGCGKPGPRRAAVSGAVTYDGKPLKSGRITFEPAPGVPGPSTAAEITDGSYEIPIEMGAAVGKNIVRVSQTKPSGKKIKSNFSDDLVDEIIEVIPAKHNTRSERVEVIEPVQNDLNVHLPAD